MFNNTEHLLAQPQHSCWVAGRQQASSPALLHDTRISAKDRDDGTDCGTSPLARRNRVGDSSASFRSHSDNSAFVQDGTTTNNTNNATKKDIADCTAAFRSSAVLRRQSTSTFDDHVSTQQQHQLRSHHHHHHHHHSPSSSCFGDDRGKQQTEADACALSPRRPTSCNSETQTFNDDESREQQQHQEQQQQVCTQHGPTKQQDTRPSSNPPPAHKDFMPIVPRFIYNEITDAKTFAPTPRAGAINRRTSTRIVRGLVQKVRNAGLQAQVAVKQLQQQQQTQQQQPPPPPPQQQQQSHVISRTTAGLVNDNNNKIISTAVGGCHSGLFLKAIQKTKEVSPTGTAAATGTTAVSGAASTSTSPITHRVLPTTPIKEVTLGPSSPADDDMIRHFAISNENHPVLVSPSGRFSHSLVDFPRDSPAGQGGKGEITMMPLPVEDGAFDYGLNQGNDSIFLSNRHQAAAAKTGNRLRRVGSSRPFQTSPSIASSSKNDRGPMPHSQENFASNPNLLLPAVVESQMKHATSDVFSRRGGTLSSVSNDYTNAEEEEEQQQFEPKDTLPQQQQHPRDHIEILKQLGEGAQGAAYLVKKKKSASADDPNDIEKKPNGLLYSAMACSTPEIALRYKNVNTGVVSPRIVGKREEVFVCKIEKNPTIGPKALSSISINNASSVMLLGSSSHNLGGAGNTSVVVEEHARQRAERQRNEAHILSNLCHPNIIGYVDFQQDVDSGLQYLFLEYVDGGDVFHHLGERRKASAYLSEVTALDTFVQVLLAIEYCHRHNIIHRDIKSQNILVSKMNNFVKLTDFGTARQFDTDIERFVDDAARGSPYYMSPEICSGKHYSEKTDMWSMGVLLYELLVTGTQFPFMANDFLALRRAVCTRPMNPIAGVVPTKEKLSDDVLSLLNSLLQKDPSKRPTALEALTDFKCVKLALDRYKTRFQKVLVDPIVKNVNAPPSSSPPSSSAAVKRRSPSTLSTNNINNNNPTTATRSVDTMYYEILLEHLHIINNSFSSGDFPSSSSISRQRQQRFHARGRRTRGNSRSSQQRIRIAIAYAASLRESKDELFIEEVSQFKQRHHLLQRAAGSFFAISSSMKNTTGNNNASTLNTNNNNTNNHFMMMMNCSDDRHSMPCATPSPIASAAAVAS